MGCCGFTQSPFSCSFLISPCIFKQLAAECNSSARPRHRGRLLRGPTPSPALPLQLVGRRAAPAGGRGEFPAGLAAAAGGRAGRRCRGPSLRGRPRAGTRQGPGVGLRKAIGLDLGSGSGGEAKGGAGGQDAPRRTHCPDPTWPGREPPGPPPLLRPSALSQLARICVGRSRPMPVLGQLSWQ